MSKLSLEQKEPYPLDSTTMKYPNERNGFAKAICSILSKITVEPMVCFFMLAYLYTGMTTQNLNLDKACNVNLKMDKSVCDAMKIRNLSGYNISQEVEVQKLIASVYMWKFAIHSISSFTILAFIGSWSDRSGRRRVCVLQPLFAEILSVSGLVICTFFFYELPMQFNVASEIVSVVLGGGMSIFLFGITTIICTKTTVEERTVRIGVLHVLFNLGLTIGIGTSGIAVSYLGFYGAYGTVLTLHLICMGYGAIIIKDDKRIQDPTKKQIGFFRDFFDLNALKDSLKVVFHNSDKLVRKKRILIFIASMLVMGPLQGEISVMYLYTRYKFQWNEIDYGLFYAIATIGHLSGSTIGLTIFSKCFKMDDAMLGVIAAISKFLGALVYAFAPTGTVFYIGIAADLLSSCMFIAMRALVTKQASGNEQGKMNSIFGLGEALVPLVYGPLYNAIYKSTIEIFPGTFYIMTSITTVPVIVIYLWMYRNRTPTVEEQPDDKEKLEKLLMP